MAHLHNLPPDSHTARRLEHATPHHLHQTTKRTFIGPIPEGWLKSHRKEWYKQYIVAGNRRAPSFRAAQPVQGNDSDDNDLPEPTPRPSSQSVQTNALSNPVGSTTSLLHNQRALSGAGSLATSTAADAPPQPETANDVPAPVNEAEQAQQGAPDTRFRKQRVRFNDSSKLQLRARAQRLATQGTFRSPKVKDGDLMRVDKMLIRIDITQQSLRSDYDEKISLGVETRSMDKWREFMVVCRKHIEDDAQAVLQLYKTRVIAVSEGKKVKKRPKVQILLSSKTAHVNLYSALDKTLCVWSTGGGGSRTTIYYLRPQSGAVAVEWFNFLSGVLGIKRPQNLQVNIPDLNVSLRLDDPFRTSIVKKTLQEAAAGDDEALVKALSDERGAAGAIVGRCIEMLKETPEWADILDAWAHYDRIGLAWKRYDRIEWVHGAVEQRMYGTIAMQRTHDLELRPKHHYPESTKLSNGNAMEEPTPVEGFLIRLTSQQGQERRLGKMLFKRLYFMTQNQYLLFLRPAKASPPPPPKMSSTGNEEIPSTQALINQVPLIYNVNPYPLEENRISWLDTEGVKSAKSQEAYDRKATNESDRNLKMTLVSDGFIDLCEVKRVRKFHRGASAADEEVDDGSDVDFHVEVTNTREDDGSTNEVDEDRTFELVMKNDLVIRLQAFNKAARKRWIKCLRDLSKYWSHRVKADMDLYRSTREQNLSELGIDERAEAFVGQFAYKWEVGKSFASPTLYNMCGIASCRTIHMSGTLFRKPRKHSTFTRCHVILSHGHLLVFQDTLRKRSGKKLVHVHHERIACISLQGSYLYSGLLTEDDLLYQNQTFDSNVPGHHALPRVYLEDGWTSTDEDAMTTFVIWHAKSRAWFRSSSNVDDVRIREAHEAGATGGGRGGVGGEDDGTANRVKTKLTRVSQLGATGRSVVFKARSRAERDHWVLAIQVEIERVAARNDDARIVGEGIDE